VTDPTGSYGFAYDNMGRLMGTTTQYTFLPGHNFQNGYRDDAASNRTLLTAPDGSTNSYNYDSLNRRTQLTRPNGVNTNYGYDSVSISRIGWRQQLCLLSKDHPALTSIVGFAPWALALHGPAGRGPLWGTLSWVGPTLAYVALAACFAALAWRLRHGREDGKSGNVSMGVTHT
jgi:YD repeat-containing protein